jgi:peroxin-5
MSHQVMQLMLQAAEFKADDADVQVVLGVLYNVSRDFGAAADALAAAAAGSADHAAWNKLGATLANSNRSEEALPAYHKALALKPRYARGWLNLAISHANLSHHDAAARCYLQALDLNPGAAHIWNYLRLTLGQMDRYDLIQAAARSDVSALRDVFPPIQNDDPTTLLP